VDSYAIMADSSRSGVAVDLDRTLVGVRVSSGSWSSLAASLRAENLDIDALPWTRPPLATGLGVSKGRPECSVPDWLCLGGREGVDIMLNVSSSVASVNAEVSAETTLPVSSSS
jgi:hypothetical protein